MLNKTMMAIATTLMMSLVSVNASSAAGWDSYRNGDTVYVESNFELGEHDPANGIYYRPVTYFAIGGDELYILHNDQALGWIPSGVLLLDEYIDALGMTILEWFEEQGFDWERYDLEDVQQIVFLGGDIGDSVNNMTDIPSTMYGGLGQDQFTGGSASDTLYGNEGDDFLHGSGGNDVLVGGTGDDELWGEEGNDTMFGDQGMDNLNGGGGADYYDYGFDKFEIGPLDYSSGKIDTIVVNSQKSYVDGVWVWQARIPRFITSDGPMDYSEVYLNQRMVIKKRYVTKYGTTWYNPDPTRQPRGIDTSRIDLR